MSNKLHHDPTIQAWRLHRGRWANMILYNVYQSALLWHKKTPYLGRTFMHIGEI